MVKFYLDNDVALGMQGLLGAREHQVLTSRSLGTERIRDDQQLLIAYGEEAILITHNQRDFVLLHNAWLNWPPALGARFPAHPGILVLQQATGIERQADAVHSLLGEATAERISGRLLRWRHGRWQRLSEMTWQPYETS